MGAKTSNVPHFLPYQGSKRRLAPAILATVGERHFARLFEPFAGSGAVTIAAAHANLADSFVLSDSLAPLAALWRRALADPDGLADAYTVLWRTADYEGARTTYNTSAPEAALLYLLARCVKNAPRFNLAGNFNQSADKRRHGVEPERLRRSLQQVAGLLHGRCEVRTADFAEQLRLTVPRDLVYLDPPYQGTSQGRDRRYHQGLDRAELVAALEDLNRRRVPFLLSYDGRCGERAFGPPLPATLGLTLLELNAGRSSQATLSGRSETTIESLYMSPALG